MLAVIPAKAGISLYLFLDSRFRGNDDTQYFSKTQLFISFKIFVYGTPTSPAITLAAASALTVRSAALA